MHAADPHDPISLPGLPPEPPRPAFPIWAALVPIAGAVVLWWVTSSPYVLWFAFLGPFLAGATMLDALRGRRRGRRRRAAEIASSLEEARAQVARRHDAERERAWRRTPGVAQYLVRERDVWRASTEQFVIGAGEVPSGVRISGGADEHAAQVRRDARWADRMPITVPREAGVAVVGPPVYAEAVLRAWQAQAAMAWLPGTVAAPRLMRALPGAPLPPEYAVVATLTAPGRARLDYEGVSREISVPVLGEPQAIALASALAERAAHFGTTQTDDPFALDDVLGEVAGASDGGLPVAFARASGQAVLVDVVRDGPHAVVAGMTGAGKSELLTSWVSALAHRYRPAQVSFLLVDFKGGRTFDHLEALPHVTGVVTDLDEAAALRAIESLRAEIRYRERELAACGARDVDAAGGILGRLVIVVDEYAALVAAHPVLHDLFADIAARGRALGMHLILASQRAAGVFRDALLANAPLRMSLRVSDAADARAVTGDASASELPGGEEARGLVVVRRPRDDASFVARVALTSPALIASVADAHADEVARRPWLPALPAVLPLADLAMQGGGDQAEVDQGGGASGVALGLIDEPEHQAQPVWMLPREGLCVIGASGSGRTAALNLVAAQAARVRWISSEPERGWDGLCALAGGNAAAGVRARPAITLIDDVDVLLSRLPDDYRAAASDLLERGVREARQRGETVVMTTQRLAGSLTRVAELLTHRLILRVAGRIEHVAAGGEASDFTPGIPPGRGRFERRPVHLAWHAPPDEAADSLRCHAEVEQWRPGVRPAALVLAPGARADGLIARWGARGVDEVRAAPSDDAPVVWGTPEQWQAQWTALTAARATCDLVVDAAVAADYRAVTGRRDLPPFASARPGRAWVLEPGEPPRRVQLPV